MQAIDDEALDAEKPYVELIDGLEIPKMSPERRHGVLQVRMARYLEDWGHQRGEVATEWRFRLDPNPERPNSFVPDVAYVDDVRLSALEDAEAEKPPFAPDIAVEIRSSGDRERNIARKIERYLEFGSRVVIDVDPRRRVVTAHDTTGARMFREGAIFEHAAAPGFRFSVSDYFASADRRRPS